MRCISQPEATASAALLPNFTAYSTSKHCCSLQQQIIKSSHKHCLACKPACGHQVHCTCTRVLRVCHTPGRLPGEVTSGAGNPVQCRNCEGLNMQLVFPSLMLWHSVQLAKLAHCGVHHMHSLVLHCSIAAALSRKNMQRQLTSARKAVCIY